MTHPTKRSPNVSGAFPEQMQFEDLPLLFYREYPARSETPIGGLLFWGGPAAIARFVIAVVIDAIKRFSIRPISHISHESRKIVLPFIAHLYAAAAITWELIILLVVTPIFGVIPSDVFTRLLPINQRKTMFYCHSLIIHDVNMFEAQ